MRPWFASRARMVAKRRRSYGCRWVLPVKVRAHVWSLKPRHAGRHPADTSSERVMGGNTLRTGGAL
jgi:hypothetical protein